MTLLSTKLTKIGPTFQTFIPNLFYWKRAYFHLTNPELDAEVAEKFLNSIEYCYC